METNYKTSTRRSIKDFVKRNSELIVMSGVVVVYGVWLYKIGYTEGLSAGKDKILDEIVQSSYSRGLIMKNPKLGRYAFIASKLND